MAGKPGGEASPSDVLRTKRLEVVDDAGTVRAVVGSREEGIGGLTVFDAGGKKRAALEAGEVPEQGSGLSLFDANGKVRAVLYAHNDPGKGAAVYVNDEDEKSRAVLGLHEGGQATLVVNAGEKDRAIKVSVEQDGRAVIMFTGDGPVIGLGSFGEDGQGSSNLILSDEKGQAGMVLDGRRHRPFIRYRDPTGAVRAGLELAPSGELEFTSFDGEGQSAAREERPLNFLWAFIFCVLIIGGALAGVWVAGSLSEVAGAAPAGSGPSFLWFLATAILISLGIAALVTFLDRLRNR